MFYCEDEGEGKGRGTGSYGIFKIMRRGGAKSCKNGLGRDNKIHLTPHYNEFYGWPRTA